MKLKKLAPILFLLLSAGVSLPLRAQYEHAGQYMEAMFAQHPQFTQALWNYVRVAARGKNAKRIENRRLELLATTSQIRSVVNRMPPYEGDASLRDSVVKYFGLVYDILNEDYAKIVNLEEIAEQSYDLMEAYILTKEKANEKLEEASDMLDLVQASFAARHRIILQRGEKSEESHKLETAGEVIKYYNAIYLPFFKCYKQEAYLLEALERTDLNSLMQNQNALAQYAREGLHQLDSLPDYAGDASLKQAAAKLFDFYLDEGTEKARVLTGFFLKQEQLQKMQAIIESKKPQERSQQDIDQYNQAVESYNQAVTAFNQANQELNAQRGLLLEDWNKAVDAFMDRHVPK
ncbi:MAG: hypothetical protein D6730_04685 [Bacteroidetes bacterium]|nr:MAG: hypothetical protein D6730_04685 [Bacteroidota bacterium]